VSVLWKIQRYLNHTGMPPTRFGRLVARDPRLVHDLKNGREPRAPMTERIEAFLAAQERQR